MNNRQSRQSDGEPLDELSPELRRAVETVLQNSPPEWLMGRALDAARHPILAEVKSRRRPSARRLRFALPVGLVAALIGVVFFLWHPTLPIDPSANREPASRDGTGLFAAKRGALPTSASTSSGSPLDAGLPEPVVARPVRTVVVLDLPTAWAYREALKQSPEALCALLDAHSQQVLRPEPSSVQRFDYSSLLPPTL